MKTKKKRSHLSLSPPCTINPYHPRPNPPHTLKTLASLHRKITTLLHPPATYITLHHSIQDLPEGRIAPHLEWRIGWRIAQQSPPLSMGFTISIPAFANVHVVHRVEDDYKGNYVSIGRHLGKSEEQGS